MNPLAALTTPLSRLDLGRMLEFRPRYPEVAIELTRGEAVIVRLRSGRRGRRTLEAHRWTSIPEASVGSSNFRPNLGDPEEMAARIADLLKKTGTRPGKISIVLPDNLAKLSILNLPERPPNRKQLQEIVRFKLRRSVPFRLEDATIAWQEIPSEGSETSILVAVLLRSVVEQYEAVFEAAGTKPGLVELCTPSLFNLCRAELTKASLSGRDAMLLNVSRSYFTLVIVRSSRLIFIRCKSLAFGDDPNGRDDGVIGRELASSFSYYEQKLSGQGVATAFVRSTALSFQDIAAILGRQGVEDVRPLDPGALLGWPSDGGIDPVSASKIAPCVGATAGRWM